MAMKTRHAARIVLVNSLRQVLMVRYDEDTAADPKKQVKCYWVPPGGGIDVGETAEQAAIRELQEETGIAILSARLVWLRERELLKKGELTLYKEKYFFAQVAGSPTPIHTANDSEGITDCQWLSLEYIERSGAVFFPDNFAYFLRPLLDGHVPLEPIFIEGTA